MCTLIVKARVIIYVHKCSRRERRAIEIAWPREREWEAWCIIMQMVMLQFYPDIFVWTYAASEPWTWILLSVKCNTQKWRRAGMFSPLAFAVFKPSLEFKELQSEYCSTCTQPFIFCTMFFSLVVIWERKKTLHSSPESNRSCLSIQHPT